MRQGASVPRRRDCQASRHRDGQHGAGSCSCVFWWRRVRPAAQCGRRRV